MSSTMGFLHKCPDGKTLIVKFKSGGWIHWFTPKSIRATVIGRTIYIKKGYLVSQISLPHELIHIEQWHRLGSIKFSIMYLYYQIRYGYDKNPLEQEARKLSGEPER